MRKIEFTYSLNESPNTFENVDYTLKHLVEVEDECAMFNVVCIILGEYKAKLSMSGLNWKLAVGWNNKVNKKRLKRTNKLNRSKKYGLKP